MAGSEDRADTTYEDIRGNIGLETPSISPPVMKEDADTPFQIPPSALPTREAPFCAYSSPQIRHCSNHTSSYRFKTNTRGYGRGSDTIAELRQLSRPIITYIRRKYKLHETFATRELESGWDGHS